MRPSSSAMIERGVKPRLMILRVASCSAPSWLSSITRWNSIISRSIPSGNRMIAEFSALEKFLESLETFETSSWRESAQ
ncbi:hypothetical protein ABIE44_000924 [Marmoricola sp. OAE513]|uniref:hypothetical protein n=1 Tax=Marmoricola sp. OAE513 TaxID=2817894 RepID=UPI00339A9DEB